MSDYMDCTCCILGLAELPDEHVISVIAKMKNEVEKALADGYKRFWLVMSGKASVYYGRGIKEAFIGHENVTLEIMVPHHISLDEEEKLYTELIGMAAGVAFATEGEEEKSLMIANNRVLDLSTRMIAVSDGTDDETESIIKIANSIEVPVYLIRTE